MSCVGGMGARLVAPDDCCRELGWQHREQFFFTLLSQSTWIVLASMQQRSRMSSRVKVRRKGAICTQFVNDEARE